MLLIFLSIFLKSVPYVLTIPNHTHKSRGKTMSDWQNDLDRRLQARKEAEAKWKAAEQARRRKQEEEQQLRREIQ
jgi:hypothetical protein